MIFHTFSSSVSHIPLPDKFTFPFHYTPHPLCILAANELQAYLGQQKQWAEELSHGKMFGVLIVETQDNQLGYLAAFSGNLAHQNKHPFFVPPVFDLLQPDGFFRTEEELISNINKQIMVQQQDSKFVALSRQLKETHDIALKAVAEAKAALKEAKQRREERRRNQPGEAELNEMIRESQYQKAEFKRLERYWQTQITALQTEYNLLARQIEQLKAERKTRSAALQQKLFNSFQMLNARGETKGLCDIFSQTAQKTPPAGAGECAAPKLLQYAFAHQLRPVAMAEFWWGESPRTEIRKHGHYYPACKGKCQPILTHMLQGLPVEEDPLLQDNHRNTQLEILFEDEWLLIVHKPAGMLSVPGKSDLDSVYTRLQKMYPEATGPMIVHRLDMATSGLLLIAKTKEVHKDLQAQFKNRSVKKRYTAILEGDIVTDSGQIELPLCLDPLDRPRQIVNEEFGKTAITTYQVLNRKNGETRIAFYPLTGRTHQLRVHAAHREGLHCPIKGDELYGKKSDRLYLHAEVLEFVHPILGTSVRIEKKAAF